MLLTDTEGACSPLVKIRLARLSVEPELGLRCEVIEHFSHQVPEQPGLPALQMELGENILQRIVSVIQKFPILNGMGINVVGRSGGCGTHPGGNFGSDHASGTGPCPDRTAEIREERDYGKESSDL